MTRTFYMRFYRSLLRCHHFDMPTYSSQILRRRSQAIATVSRKQDLNERPESGRRCGRMNGRLWVLPAAKRTAG